MRPPRISDEIGDTPEGAAFLELLKVVDHFGLEHSVTYRKFICGYEYYGSTIEDKMLDEFGPKPWLMQLAGDQDLPEIFN
jgi:hypothetical protein